MADQKQSIRDALISELEFQNPDMVVTAGNPDTVWLSGGCTPQSSGCTLNLNDLVDAIAQATGEGA